VRDKGAECSGACRAGAALDRRLVRTPRPAIAEIVMTLDLTEPGRSRALLSPTFADMRPMGMVTGLAIGPESFFM
jgi:hypothetical protein